MLRPLQCICLKLIKLKKVIKQLWSWTSSFLFDYVFIVGFFNELMDEDLDPNGDLYDAVLIRRRADLSRLKKLERPLHELLVRESFLVERVVRENITLRGCLNENQLHLETRGHNPVVGFIPMSRLYVSPCRSELPVSELLFSKHIHIRYGERISALIPLYEEKENPLYSEEGIFGKNEKPIYYIPREFTRVENAIAISVSKSKVEKASNYEMFTRPVTKAEAS